MRGLGAASAWSALEAKEAATPPLAYGELRGVAPAVLAVHVEEVLGRVQRELRPVAGRLHMPRKARSRGAVSSRPAPSAKGRWLVGRSSDSTRRRLAAVFVEFIESVEMLSAG